MPVRPPAQPVAEEASLAASRCKERATSEGVAHFFFYQLFLLIAERAESREGTTLASVDPVNRELGLYFDDTLKPETRDPSGIARWLSGFVDSALAAKDNAMVDMGGGDASLSRLWTDRPDLPEQIEAAGIELIALFMLSGRPIDLTPLNDMTGLGFAP